MICDEKEPEGGRLTGRSAVGKLFLTQPERLMLRCCGAALRAMMAAVRGLDGAAIIRRFPSVQPLPARKNDSIFAE